MKKLIAALMLVMTSAHAGVLLPLESPVDPTKEYRICGVPLRADDGRILRSNRIKAAYRRIHPCPSTGSRNSAEACPDWSIQHVIPLASGGCDSVVNMMWLPNKIKTCAGQYCVDRWERKYYGDPYGVITFTPDTK